MNIRHTFAAIAAILILAACAKEGSSGSGEIPALRDITVKISMEKGSSSYDFSSAGYVHYVTDAGDAATVQLEKNMTFTASVSAEAKTIKAFIGTESEISAIPATQKKSFLSSDEDFAAGMAAWSEPAEVGANDATVTMKPFTSGILLRLYDSKHYARNERILEVRLSSGSDAKVVWQSAEDDFALRIGDLADAAKVGMIVMPQASSDARFTVVTNRNTYEFTKGKIALKAGEIAEVALDFASPDKQPIRKVGILGDSISTFAGYIDPTYSAWYPASDANGTGTVQSVEKTYWWKVINEKMKYGELDVNNSYSGTKVITEGGVKGFVDRAYRFKDPDIIIIHGGTNDKNQSSTLGTYDFDLPMGQLNDMFYRSAYIKLIKMLQNRYEGVEIIIIVGDMLTEGYAKSNIEIAKHFGLPCVDFTAGGTKYNDTANFPKSSGSHPNATGHQYMADAIYAACKDYLP